MNNELSRRQFLLAMGLAGWTVVDGLPQATAASASARQPNILYIMADDMGYADLSCYGQRNFTTPVLDKLAAQGVRLTQGYANSAVCSATRTALVSGRYQYRVPCGLQEPIAAANAPGLPQGHPTLPSLLRAQGYRTALVGKWHVGGIPQYGPTRYGYEHFFGISSGAADYFKHGMGYGEAGDHLWNDESPVQRAGYLTDILGDAAIEWLGKPDTRPFFLSLHFNAPHWPWEGPEDMAVAEAIKDVRHADGGSLATYAVMMTRMDEVIGRVLAKLKKMGAERDTIVVFTSDNGGERYSDTWPFTGTKGELLEGGIRVPLIVRWPRGIKAGGTSEQVMTSMDFLPTFLAAAGGAPDPAYPSDGMNLLPVLQGQSPVQTRKLYWRFKANEQSAVRDGDWKYLKLGGKEHLFNLAMDARERADMKSLYPERFAQLKADFAAWNSTMLPYPDDSFSEDVKAHYHDRY